MFRGKKWEKWNKKPASEGAVKEALEAGIQKVRNEIEYLSWAIERIEMTEAIGENHD